MIEITHLKEAALHLLPGPGVGTRRAACDDCGAHAAVVTTGASVTGACSVCGSAKLQVLDEYLAPPRRWAS